MRKGQIFTMDLFLAYSLFMILMLLLFVFSANIVYLMEAREFNDRIQQRIIYAEDYLVYSEKYNTEPYLFNATAIDAFFAQNDTQIRDELQFQEMNYSIQVIQLNGGVVKLEAGSVPDREETAVSLQRFVMYQSQKSKLVVTLWEQ